MESLRRAKSFQNSVQFPCNFPLPSHGLCLNRCLLLSFIPTGCHVIYISLRFFPNPLPSLPLQSCLFIHLTVVFIPPLFLLPLSHLVPPNIFFLLSNSWFLLGFQTFVIFHSYFTFCFTQVSFVHCHPDSFLCHFFFFPNDFSHRSGK